jgi:hypothetical protein
MWKLCTRTYRFEETGRQVFVDGQASTLRLDKSCSCMGLLRCRLASQRKLWSSLTTALWSNDTAGRLRASLNITGKERTSVEGRAFEVEEEPKSYMYVG